MGEDIPRPEWSDWWQRLRSDRRVGAALFAGLALAAGVAWWRAGASGSPPAVATPGPTTSARRSASTTVAASEVVVDVVGAVKRAGIVRLRTGARVVDAIAAAGGPTAAADLAQLNLAAVLADGTRIAVPNIGEAIAVPGSAPATGPTVPSGPMNLNTATAEQLDALPGIGPATAAAIVSDRDAHGPFATVDDLSRVRGIGPAKLEQLRELVTV